MTDPRTRPAFMPASPAHQRGAGKLVLLLLLIVLIFFINLAVRVVPVYVEFMYARSIINSTLEDTRGEFDRFEFQEAFQRRARVNQVSLDNDVFSFQGTGPVNITLDYERRVPVLFNVDAIIYFNEQFSY